MFERGSASAIPAFSPCQNITVALSMFERGSASAIPAFSPCQNSTVALSILDSTFHRIKLSSLMKLSSRR
uniref:Uncharacterized protein n=1 Tax=Arundo donax TaxID=35708 RepID=A0A0A9AXZ3_ARUDO